MVQPLAAELADWFSYAATLAHNPENLNNAYTVGHGSRDRDIHH